jgi:hypothetical protein
MKSFRGLTFEQGTITMHSNMLPWSERWDSVIVGGYELISQKGVSLSNSIQPNWRHILPSTADLQIISFYCLPAVSLNLVKFVDEKPCCIWRANLTVEYEVYTLLYITDFSNSTKYIGCSESMSQTNTVLEDSK